jgi:hypothetical protein
MSGLSQYESRRGILTCTPEEFFYFVTDLRNLGQFVPEGNIRNWTAAADTCSFNVAFAGDIHVRLEEKVPHTKVVFNGDALKENDFRINIEIDDEGFEKTGAKVFLEADLNPVLKMMAGSSINQFLEILVSEMEKFRGWKVRGE